MFDRIIACCLCFVVAFTVTIASAEPSVLNIPAANAKNEAEMKPYVELIEHTEESFDMLPIRGGKFVLGSATSETGHKPDEAPQTEIEIAPFWMAKCEITWDVYDVWMSDLDIVRREAFAIPANARDKAAEPLTISKPTKPYTDMTFGMGKQGYPAICMTQHAARTFCQWLTIKTGRYYRLPTEAEWEYACRAGTITPYSFGDNAAQLGDYAWYLENSDEKYQKVGKKKPNPWGLHDMHGNVSEWVLDQYHAKFYGTLTGKSTNNPLNTPKTEYPRVVRGGSWDSKPEQCRSAARRGSDEEWKQQDPQEPRSIWYFTDALWVGFRVVRPLQEPSAEEKANFWEKSEPVMVDNGGKE
jgi:formylglycine-generating enzyme required for sulfatase activity